MVEVPGVYLAIFPNLFIYNILTYLSTRIELFEVSRCLGFFRFVYRCFGVRWAPFGHYSLSTFSLKLLPSYHWLYVKTTWTPNILSNINLDPLSSMDPNQSYLHPLHLAHPHPNSYFLLEFHLHQNYF